MNLFVIRVVAVFLDVRNQLQSKIINKKNRKKE